MHKSGRRQQISLGVSVSGVSVSETLPYNAPCNVSLASATRTSDRAHPSPTTSPSQGPTAQPSNQPTTTQTCENRPQCGWPKALAPKNRPSKPMAGDTTMQIWEQCSHCPNRISKQQARIRTLSTKSATLGPGRLGNNDPISRTRMPVQIGTSQPPGRIPIISAGLSSLGPEGGHGN